MVLNLIPKVDKFGLGVGDIQCFCNLDDFMFTLMAQCPGECATGQSYA